MDRALRPDEVKLKCNTYSKVKLSPVSDARREGHDEEDEDDSGKRAEKMEPKLVFI